MKNNDILTKNLNGVFNVFDNQINQKDIIIKNLENQLMKVQFNKYGNVNKKKLNEKINISPNNVSNYKKANSKANTNLGKNGQTNIDELKRNKYRNIIYNRLNNINDENHNENVINDKEQQKNIDIHYKGSDNKVNSEYFKENQEIDNNIDSNKEINKIQTDEDKMTDLDELINKNNLFKNNQEVEHEPEKNENEKNNNINEQLFKQKKETDELGEIAEQINAYNGTFGLANINQANANESPDNINPINIYDQDNENNLQEQEQDQNQENEEYEYNINIPPVFSRLVIIFHFPFSMFHFRTKYQRLAHQ